MKSRPIIVLLEDEKTEKQMKPIEILGYINDEYKSIIEVNNHIPTLEHINNEEKIKVIKVEGYNSFDCLLITSHEIYTAKFNDGFL